MGILFDLLFFVYGVFYLPVFVLKGKHRVGWGERWGRIPQGVLTEIRGRSVVWIHAVSVGETRLACHLIRQARPHLTGTRFLLTTTTFSGRTVARRELGEKGLILFFPFDFTFVVRRFVGQVRPSVLVLLETELWPNLVRELERRGIPVVVANARISDRAYWKYRAASFLLKSTFRRIDRCMAQTEAYRDRLIRLGFRPESVTVSGNMKYDLGAPNEAHSDRWLEELGRLKEAQALQFLVCASTHAGEEEICLATYRRLRTLHSNLRLVVAPRHVERVDAVESMMRSNGFSWVRLSRLDGSASGMLQDIVLVDLWGALGRLYEIADLVFMGGSLVPHGGHNLTEPALVEKAILHGPHMGNFLEMTRLFVSHGGSCEVQDEADFERSAHRLLGDEERRRDMGRTARRILEQNRGATSRILDEVLDRVGSAKLSE